MQSSAQAACCQVPVPVTANPSVVFSPCTSLAPGLGKCSAAVMQHVAQPLNHPLCCSSCEAIRWLKKKYSLYFYRLSSVLKSDWLSHGVVINVPNFKTRQKLFLSSESPIHYQSGCLATKATPVTLAPHAMRTWIREFQFVCARKIKKCAYVIFLTCDITQCTPLMKHVFIFRANECKYFSPSSHGVELHGGTEAYRKEPALHGWRIVYCTLDFIRVIFLFSQFL